MASRARPPGRRPPRPMPQRGERRDEPRSRLAANLIRGRMAADLTQSELAEAIGVSCRCIQAWETDRAWPTLHKFSLAAEVLDMTMDDLWYGGEDRDGE